MAHAIEMFFDEQADAAVRGLWHRLADAGLPSLATYGHARHRPHVSLTVASNLEVQDPAVLADICSAMGPLPGFEPLDAEAIGALVTDTATGTVTALG